MTSEMRGLGAVISPLAADSARGVSVDATPKARPADVKEADVSKPAELELTLDLQVVQRAAETVSQFIETVSRDLHVAYDDSIDMPIFTVVDSETNEVIRQIPSEDLVAIARFLESQGVGPSGAETLAGILLSEET